MNDNAVFAALESRCYAENRSPTLSEWRELVAEIDAKALLLDEEASLLDAMREERNDAIDRYAECKRLGDALAEALGGLLDTPDLKLDELEDETRESAAAARRVLSDWELSKLP
jgi:hypothetical protein